MREREYPTLMGNAAEMLRRWKGPAYDFGQGVLDRVGPAAARYGKKVLVVASGSARQGQYPVLGTVLGSLHRSQVQVLGDIVGFSPNSPISEIGVFVKELSDYYTPDVVVGIGAGSTLDAIKAGIALYVLDVPIQELFGVGKVSAKLAERKSSLTPYIAVQMASSSSAHLTKYSNVTDRNTSQKFLIIDTASGIVPHHAVFDPRVTVSMPDQLTVDGTLDGVAHSWEVFMGAEKKEGYFQAKDLFSTNAHLAFHYARIARTDPTDLEARTALALATDLGGYSIMLPGLGTSFPHLFSFSMVDIASHGRAVAAWQPYALAFFGPAIEEQARELGDILQEYGFLSSLGRGYGQFHGKDLGVAVAEGLRELNSSLGVPPNIADLGFTDAHADRILAAASNPALRSKFQQAPINLLVTEDGKVNEKASRENIEAHLRPLIEAARTGDFSKIKHPGLN